MKVVQFSGKEIQGIHIRTNNADEMNPKTAKISLLYQHFDNVVSVDFKGGARIYGAYFDYESDASGEFSVLAGVDKVKSSTERLEKITLPSGKYAVFEGKGEMPQCVIETWEKVWAYFSQDDVPYKRAYTTDFEFYKNQNEVHIYIAIQ